METLFTPHTLGNQILNILQSGEIKIIDLIQKLRQNRSKLTKQGVYAKIRDLKHKNIVITYHGYLALNLEWLKELNHFLSLAQFHHMNPNSQSGHFGYLQLKESVSYSFSNLLSLDQFANQALHFLLEIHTRKEPFYAYDPHTWPYFLRLASETSLIKKARESNHVYYQLVAGNTLLDKKAGEFADNKHSYYHSAIQSPFKKDNHYVYCIGEFVMEIDLSQAIQKEIEQLYVTSNMEGFAKLKLMKGKSRLVIRRDGARSKKISDKILKELKRQGVL